MNDIGDDIEEQVEHIMPLKDVAEYTHASYRQLSEWERRRSSTGFPDPKEKLGKYKLYDVHDILRWEALWKKATKNTGNRTLNGGTNGAR